MTDVARRQARSQKQRLDSALLERRRREALAELGENLYDLATRGEIELDDLPELLQTVQAVEQIDQEIAEAEAASGGSRGRGRARRPVRLGRARAADPPADGRERVWRPPVEPSTAEPDLDPPAAPNRAAPEPRSEPPGVERRAATVAAARRGGIVFVEDDPAEIDKDDPLDSYMNDDDVPRRR